MLHPLDGKVPQIHPRTFIAAGAHIVGEVSIGEYSSVWFNAVVRADVDRITLGRYVNIQDGSVLHVDEGVPLEVADHVTVGHRAVLHGCRVEEGAMVGMGAVLLDGAVLGEGALLAAGSLVPEGKRIPPRSLAMGVPARVIRTLTADEVDNLRRWAEMYAEKWLRFYAEGGV